MKWIGKIGSQRFRKRYNRATKEGTSTNDKKRKNTHNCSNEFGIDDSFEKSESQAKLVPYPRGDADRRKKKEN